MMSYLNDGIGYNFLFFDVVLVYHMQKVNSYKVIERNICMHTCTMHLLVKFVAMRETIN